MARTPTQTDFSADDDTVLKYAGAMWQCMDEQKKVPMTLTELRRAATRDRVDTEALKIVGDLRKRKTQRRVTLIANIFRYIKMFGIDKTDQISLPFDQDRNYLDEVLKDIEEGKRKSAA